LITRFLASVKKHNPAGLNDLTRATIFDLCQSLS
jgi:hypothetical protein